MRENSSWPLAHLRSAQLHIHQPKNLITSFFQNNPMNIPVSEGASPGGALANPGGGFDLLELDAEAAEAGAAPKAPEPAVESLKLPMNTAENASLKNSDEDPPTLEPKAEEEAEAEEPAASSSESIGPSRSCARRSASSDSYLVSSTLPLVKNAGSAAKDAPSLAMTRRFD